MAADCVDSGSSRDGEGEQERTEDGGRQFGGIDGIDIGDVERSEVPSETSGDDCAQMQLDDKTRAARETSGGTATAMETGAVRRRSVLVSGPAGVVMSRT